VSPDVRIRDRTGTLPQVELQETLGGRYKLLHELGTGGTAVVWRARDEVLGRPVAVKVLAGRFAGDPQSRARIRDEARAAATLSHPNIAQVYDYGESTEGDSPLPYVVMEFVNGPTLQQRVAGGPLPPRTIFRICGEVAAALAAAHADGLVHRDIKMANIMVTPTGAKVVDFGIAAAVGPAAPEEMLVGTPAYLAPERLTGDAVQPASDVYALGVLLYRLLAHEAPWTVETTTQMLNAHIYIEPSPMPALPGVPPDVADLIDRCLRKNPADRPSAAEVSATLGDAAEASLLAVRGDDARPVPPAVDEEFDESTSVSARRRAPEQGEESSGVGSGSAAMFVPGAEIGAVREPLPVDDRPGQDDQGRAAGSGDGTTTTPTRGGRRHRDDEQSDAVAGGRGRDDERDDRLGGTRIERDLGWPGGAGSWIPEARPGSRVEAGRSGAVGGEADRVRKRRLMYLLAGGGVAAVLTAVLILWGLSGQSRTTAQTPSGNVGGVVAASPSDAPRPTPSVSGGGSATLSDGTVVTGKRALRVSGPVASTAPSAAVSASSTGGAPEPSSSAASPAPSAPDGTRMTSAGGVVYAVCDQGKAQLTSWEAAPGYSVQKVDQGPAIAPEVVFKGASARYRMTVTCVAGTPAPLVLPL
jgi:predicted Ser/Thr protein kinase